MSSSYRLRRRRDDPTWQGMPAMEDHYILPQGECHPSYYAQPIGSPDGVKVCIRKPKVSPAPTPVPKSPTMTCSPSEYGTGAPFGGQCFREPVRTFDMYTPGAEPRVTSQPDYLNDRRMPSELRNIDTNMYRKPTRYNATGIPGHSSPRMFSSGCPPNMYEELEVSGAEPTDDYDVTRAIQRQVTSSVYGRVQPRGMVKAFVGERPPGAAITKA